MLSDDRESTLPASNQTEITVLGAMIVDKAARADALSGLRPADFLLDSHQRIFSAIHAASAALPAGSPGDHLLIETMDELSRRKQLDAVGGASYLAFLSEGIPRHPNILSYIRILRDHARLRQGMGVGQRLFNYAQDASEDPRTVLTRSYEEIKALLEEDDDLDIQSVGDYLSQPHSQPETIFEHMASTDGILYDFAQLDEATGGAHPGDLVVVAARPSMGKTAWVCNIASSMAVRRGYRVALFTLEQKRKYIIRRMLAASARVEYSLIQKNQLRASDRQILLERREMLKQAPLFIEDRPKLTASKIHTMCARLKAQQGLDVIIIDQLSKVNDNDVREKGMPKHERVGKQSTQFKQMGQELGVPVILLNQIGRESARRTDPTPTLTDLKESGSLEEDADVVLFLHRPEYYDRSNEDLKGKGQIIIAKQREGVTKTIHCSYRGDIMRWEDTKEPKAQQATIDDGYYVDPPETGYHS